MVKKELSLREPTFKKNNQSINQSIQEDKKLVRTATNECQIGGCSELRYDFVGLKAVLLGT